MINLEEARSALNSLNPSCPREEWIRIGMAAKSAGLSFDDFHDWSKNAGNYAGEKDCKSVWKSFDGSGGITAATLFGLAFSNNYKASPKMRTNSANDVIGYQERKSGQPFKSEDTNKYALEIWERCLPASSSHEYILRKQGKPDGLRFYPSGEQSLKINGQNVTDYLVVPCWSNGEIQTIQFIPPDGGDKLNLSGASFNNGYFTVGEITASAYVCESIGVAWSINKVTGISAVVCFGAGRMMAVTKVLRAKYPDAHLILVPDRGKEILAAEIADVTGSVWVRIPSQFPPNYDANDYLLKYGENALRELLVQPEMPLGVIFADTLPLEFAPPDELVEGMLTIGDGSILYGDSNSGKTFFVIDLACAIARGVNWMGRKTEPGLVIYLAAESPASVQRRLQAYQRHNEVRVTNFAIIQSPIDLFDGDADTDAVIKVVHLLENQSRQKACLIVGDTLARLSAGANENAGQDMSLVVRRFDRIRNECKAHFMLIHHSGKNAAAGARGWSGVRAAVDTEIEVTDTPAGRCAEITKQRDLGTKGDRIGFRLEPVTLGLTKWKFTATSCVVVPSEAPPKKASKRISEIGGAITEYLHSRNELIKKRDLVKHFKTRYTSSAIYREIKKLVEAGTISDSMGLVSVKMSS